MEKMPYQDQMPYQSELENIMTASTPAAPALATAAQ